MSIEMVREIGNISRELDNENFKLDKSGVEEVNSTSSASTADSYEELNLIKALIKIMYDQGKINKLTYEASIKKIEKEARQNVKGS